jgi:beta-mannosidase
MKILPLDSGWRFIGRESQSSPAGDLLKPDIQSGEWLPIAVPGDVNAALVKQGKMPDPHFDTQARACYWVTAKEWWYHLSFAVDQASDAPAELCLTGVDGHADIWLNNHYLGETRNAFREFRFPVSGLLREGDNVLLIRFQSIDQLLGGPRLDELGGWKGRRAFLRKPQFSFGWDWALPLPSIGLSGQVWIELDNACRFADFALQPFCSGRVDFSFEVSRAAKEAGYQIALAVSGHGAQIERTISRDAHKSYTSLDIANPQLWFPNGYGAQPLYDYVARLEVSGQVVDERRGRFGLRESRIVEAPFSEEAGPGMSFNIEINGERIFCKGANWAPLEIWPGAARREQYEFYLRRAQEANFNMLRIWGGGIYEPEVFYELCDELGIMVWQDFMFAGAGYPVDRLRDEIIAEANDQIRRLRNHSSIVLWCGCNEDVYSWSYQGHSSLTTQSDTGVYSATENSWRVNRLKDDPQIYSMILRGLVGLLGLGVPYVESSPQSRYDYGNHPSSGNCHISCWKYALFEANNKPERFRDHFDQVCSFDSEFCIQGPCAVKTIKRFMAAEHLWPPDENWVYHIQRGHRNLPHHEQTMLIAGAIMGEIDSLQKYVKHGQATHVEMMRAEYESARRDRPNNGGTMVWMFNDCWPTANWSLIDYYRNPKPSYYAAKRACAPWLPIIMARSGTVEFFFGNDSLEDLQVDLRYGQETLSGETVWERQKRLQMPKNGTMRLTRLSRAELTINPGDYLYIEAVANGQKLPRAIYFPDGWRDIPWPQPHITLQIIKQEQVADRWLTRLHVQTDAFARLAHLLYQGAGEASFSDNYFDLSAGHSHDITVSTSTPLSLTELQVGHWWSEWE